MLISHHAQLHHGLGEIAPMELLGHQRITPEQYADIVAPFWIKVLFGVVPESG